ncbi:MAG: hypothetical protein ACRD09_00745 [Vicinamibacterales bacterium]
MIFEIFVAFVVLLLAATTASAQSLDDAQRLFYSGRYEAAAALARDIRTADAENLAASELRSSALLFQIKRAVGDFPDRDKAWQLCSVCPDLLAAFLAETNHGRAAARATVERNPNDDAALFFLGKLDLNYVWLQLETLGRKKGWSEYWEARKSLDTLLKRNPGHVRARVARAWIDYIVDTKLPRGTRWLVGGGSRERGLLAVREAANADADFFTQAEAAFALWNMQVRERNFTEALTTARSLSSEFPENQDLARFITRHESVATR